MINKARAVVSRVCYWYIRLLFLLVKLTTEVYTYSQYILIYFFSSGLLEVDKVSSS